MARTRIDFDTATMDGDVLEVTGSAPPAGAVRLIPRLYRTPPVWAEVDVVVETGGPSADVDSTDSSAPSERADGFTVTCELAGVVGTAGVRVVGQTRVVTIPSEPGPSPTPSGSEADPAADHASQATTERPGSRSDDAVSGVIVTTTVPAPPSVDGLVDEARRLAQGVFGADPSCRHRWVTTAAGSVTVVAVWDDEIAYRRCAVSDAYYEALERLRSLSDGDATVEVATIVG